MIINIGQTYYSTSGWDESYQESVVKYIQDKQIVLESDGQLYITNEEKFLQNYKPVDEVYYAEKQFVVEIMSVVPQLRVKDCIKLYEAGYRKVEGND